MSTDSNLKNFLNSINLAAFGQSLGDVGKVRAADVGARGVKVGVKPGVLAQSVHDPLSEQFSTNSLRETGAESSKFGNIVVEVTE